ncbi:glycerol kinase GlpK [Prosthecomicrobium pneumaticum]|uniref:Glycerol kinase n=1 Tax=Prosthecomicrobium pneumaticum TaxID=81895 RepID=A0A7W9FM15_9HYPH|nr:glycerol kinase GlpK [Prosthecomicrobium pneumaticum]MBB5753168.1 glycerol kinase [Prosthecomicrobium pneumaticum]
MGAGYVLAIDQGTTSSRALLFDADQRLVAAAQQEFPQYFPASGWVEHDAEEIWASVVAVIRAAIGKAGIAPSAIAAIGITNQRETAVVWERDGGRPIHRAIVWQDRRTAEDCAALRRDGVEAEVTARTGLLLDPYFSGTKLAWLLDRVEGARAKAEAGALAFGTIDSFLLWRLTGGRAHRTDATNASRTLLYDIHRGGWSEELCRLLRVPAAVLAEDGDCAADFGTTDPALFGAAIPICGMAGDQQAATIGQACFTPGMVKSTYGTGCFALLNTGSKPIASRHRLLTTIAYRLAGRTSYALEGSIFVAGAAVQWLRDGLKLIASAQESGPLAATADPNQSVYLVPAFTGLGAPWWDAEARGALFGLTRATGPAELARAALESVAYQTLDLVEAMRQDWTEAGEARVLRVDGGMIASDWTMQAIADILAAPVDRPTIVETTALGAAWLAASHAGLWPDQQGFAARWQCDRRFQPTMPAEVRDEKVAGWRDAVRRTLSGAGAS